MLSNDHRINKEFVEIDSEDDLSFSRIESLRHLLVVLSENVEEDGLLSSKPRTQREKNFLAQYQSTFLVQYHVTTQEMDIHGNTTPDNILNMRFQNLFLDSTGHSASTQKKLYMTSLTRLTKRQVGHALARYDTDLFDYHSVEELAFESCLLTSDWFVHELLLGPRDMFVTLTRRGHGTRDSQA